jgi:aspartyl-tRNA(Asn)/glutamyl-tRNA(Gln) amidotransferase subunit A
VRGAVDELRSQGAAVERVEVSLLEEAGTILQAILLPEATEVHLPWLRTRLADYGPDVRARLLSGLVLPSTAYVTGVRARRWFLDGLSPLFDRFDVLAQPAMPVAPPRIEDETVLWNGERVPYRLSVIPYNSPWALAGAPVVSVPCGFVDGMPMGFALAGRPGGDATVLRAAAAFQRATDWHERRPDLEAAGIASSPITA